MNRVFRSNFELIIRLTNKEIGTYMAEKDVTEGEALESLIQEQADVPEGTDLRFQELPSEE